MRERGHTQWEFVPIGGSKWLFWKERNLGLVFLNVANAEREGLIEMRGGEGGKLGESIAGA